MQQNRSNNQPRPEKRIPAGLIILFLLMICLPLVSISCSGAASLPDPGPAPAEPSLQSPRQTATEPLQPTETSIPLPITTWLDPSLPALLRSSVSADQDHFLLTNDPENALLLISTAPGEPAGYWLYLAAAPFYSDRDAIQLASLRDCWQSGQEDTGEISQILIDEGARIPLSDLWGEPDHACIRIVNPDELTDALWLERDAVALLPFEQIGPAYKILPVDGVDPLAPDFEPARYPLKLQVNFQGPASGNPQLAASIPISNYQRSRLSIVALTGVTALVRDTAVIMEEKGLTYPAGDILDILITADITHINNEVPFAEDCPPPRSTQNSLLFCSDDRYMELLSAIGTDIVELSGDHFGDWGNQAMLHTLDLYQNAGMLFYGGGESLSAGLAPVIIEHNGNRIAFIGCNGKALDRYATASADNPGAVKCDFDWMIPEIERLASAGYLVIATMQHEEVDSFNSIAWQRYDFRRLSEAGAAIVSGSQAHHPQAFEYSNGSFIHYGLGNLFFDQHYLAINAPEVHQNKDKSFIDLHYFYNGKYINTRLIPLQFIDNARPRPMTAEEKSGFLDQVFEYSLWENKWVYLYKVGFYENRE